jgi:uncharacterized caspase-like protein
MAEGFSNGYALLIGVNESQVPGWALPKVAADIDALHTVLVNPERCGYLSENVKVIKGKGSTRQGILAGMAWLQEKIAVDKSGNATAILYYTGHGWCDTDGPATDHYLIPFDVQQGQIKLTALRSSDFASAVQDLAPKRLFVALDCCYAAGVGAKDLPLPYGMKAAAVPVDLFVRGEKAVAIAIGTKGLEGLTRGSGRAVISSSQGGQVSWLRRDGSMSIFTYHLIEALTGHAQPAEGATEVLVTDVMSYVHRKVPVSAMKDWKAEQQPDYQLSGNFPVALLLGGKGLAMGTTAPDPLTPLKDMPPLTPEPNRTTVFDMRGQKVGSQININKISGGFVQQGWNVRGAVQQAERDIKREDEGRKKAKTIRKRNVQKKRK